VRVERSRRRGEGRERSRQGVGGERSVAVVSGRGRSPCCLECLALAVRSDDQGNQGVTPTAAPPAHAPLLRSRQLSSSLPTARPVWRASRRRSIMPALSRPAAVACFVCVLLCTWAQNTRRDNADAIAKPTRPRVSSRSTSRLANPRVCLTASPSSCCAANSRPFRQLC
jgi:hypothetical protein